MRTTHPALRRGLYALNLAVGMLLFVCAYSFVEAVSRSITTGLDSFGDDAILVGEPESGFTGGTRPAALDRAAYERLRAALGDRYAATPLARSYEEVTAGDGGGAPLVSVWRGEPELLAVAGLQLVSGRGFTDWEVGARADVCLVSAELSNELGVAPGARDRLLVEGRACRVVGVVASDEVIPTLTVARNVYLPFGWVSAANPADALPVTQILLRHRAGPPPPSAAAEIGRALGDAGGRVKAWFAAEHWRLRVRIARALRVLVLAMAGVVLGMAALGLANSLSVDVLQRRGEIGLRMALGATRADIFAMFLRQGAGVVLAGGLGGAAVGVALTLGVVAPLVEESDLLGGTALAIDGETLIAALLVLAAAAALSCVVPARRAMMLDPSLAIRSL